MILRQKIQSFVRSLSEYESDTSYNQWTEWDRDLDIVPDAWINRRLALEDHMNCDAKYILVGEAPGYQGCRYSGIPFTSERLLYEGAIPRLEFMRYIRITRRRRPFSEPSATIVWRVLKKLGIEHETVLFNAFPFHPFKPGKPLSNRTPTKEERIIGLDFLDAFVCLYPTATIIAIGNMAHESLFKTGRIIHFERPLKVRHPARGGATKFKNQLSEIVNNP